MRNLKISRLPVFVSWLFYAVAVVIILTTNLSTTVKLPLLLTVSFYLFWWQYRTQQHRFETISVITLDDSWVLADSRNQCFEAHLTGSSQFRWGVILHLNVETKGHCSVLVMRNSENSDTFRQLRSYLTHQLTH